MARQAGELGGGIGQVLEDMGREQQVLLAQRRRQVATLALETSTGPLIIQGLLAP